MSRSGSIAGRAPAIIIALVALMISLGGGAYATTRSTPHTPPKITSTAITWSSLSLVNGWVSANSTNQTGDPRVAIQNGVVYLSGGLDQSSGTNAVFATLPLSFRPAHNMYVPVSTNAGTSGLLYIAHDGTMKAYSPSSCSSTQNSAQCFTSLATVSYPKSS
jgi:hypothetical protein